MAENYAVFAADWWTNLVRDSNSSLTRDQLDKFKNVLTRKLRQLIASKGVLCISTYERMNDFLYNTAYEAGVPIDFPKGYEMKILIDDVRVYNCHGQLIANL